MENLKISYDIWSTLLKSNPQFKEERIKLASKFFKVSENSVSKKLKNIKEWTDKRVEMFGMHYPRQFLYSMIFKASTEKINDFINQVDDLFIKNPPIKMNDVIKGHDLYITSNTVLIYGDVMSTFIEEYFGIPRERMIFSDDINWSKPNPKIFQAHNVDLNYHIGDNIVTDGACENIGIRFVHIDNHNNFIESFQK